MNIQIVLIFILELNFLCKKIKELLNESDLDIEKAFSTSYKLAQVFYFICS